MKPIFDYFAAFTGNIRIAAISIVVAVLAVLTTITGNGFAAFVIGIPAYLILPGLLLMLATRRRTSLGVNTFLYSVALSLLFWIVGGLALNTFLPYVGINRPLQLAFVLPLYLISVSALSAVIVHRGPVVRPYPLKMRLNFASIVASLVALALPVLSVFGANTLNNGGSSVITVTMLLSICAYVMWLVIARRRVTTEVYPVAIFGAGLSLLLMYSMRSSHVLGWDIHQELRVFTRTLTMERWNMSDYTGLAYNACLSITILPAILAKLFHMAPEYVYKFLYQVIFAVLPIAIYQVARRFLLPVLALLAALFFVGQTWFFELMPALARQEIALIFFGLFILAFVDQSLSMRFRRSLLFAFAFGIVVSHYSTAYIWLILTVFAMVIMYVVRIFSKRAREVPRTLSWPLLIFGALSLFIWEVTCTQTAGNAGSVATNAAPQLAQAFSPTVLEAGLVSALIAPPAPDNNKTMAVAYKQASTKRLLNDDQFFDPSTYNGYRPVTTGDESSAPNLLGPLGAVLHLSATLLKAVTSNLATALGIVVLAIFLLKRKVDFSLDFIAMSAAGYVLIVAVLLIPYLQEAYNLTRLGLQVFILLAIPAISGLWFVVRRNARYGLPIMGLVVVSLLILQTGLLDQVSGGPLRLTLSQPRGTFDTYYVSDSEVAAAQWLGRERVTFDPVFSDSVGALRLSSYMDYATDTPMFPSTIPKDSYVYLDSVNIVRRHSYYEYNNFTLTYDTPIAFLNANKNLIYSSGGAEIYR